MPSQDLQLTLRYDDTDNDAVVYSRTPVTASWGFKDEGEAIGVAECTATLDDADGAYRPADTRSPLYGKIGRGTPATVYVGPEVLADGTVQAWAPDHTVGGDAWTDIRITGPSARVNAPGTPFSALRSTLEDEPAVAGYWPMEGYSAQPTSVESAVEGVNDSAHRQFSELATTAFNWPGDATLPGSKNLPMYESNQFTAAGITAAVSIDPDPAVALALWTRTPIPTTSEATNLNVQAVVSALLSGQDGVGYSLRVTTYPPGSTLATVPADGEVVLSMERTVGPDIIDSVEIIGLPYADGWRHIYGRLSTSGADVAVTLMLDGEVVGTGTLSPGELGNVGTVRTSAGGFDPLVGAQARVAVGHEVIATGTTAELDALAAVMYQAGLGYPGESCQDRFERLCAERGVPCFVYDDGDDPHLMGPQYPDTLPNLLLEIARTDGGMIYDARDYDELEFRPLRTMYGQEPGLVLTYGVNVPPPIKPVVDDLGGANDITAAARTGATRRAVQRIGPNNVSNPADDPDGIGRVEGKLDVNPSEDQELVDIAAWALHRATWPGARYRNVTVDLDEHPDLVADVMALRPGDILAIDGLDADRVELLILGATDIPESHRRMITFNCAPGGPFRVGQVDVTGLNRMGSASSSLAADFEAGVDTSMSVAVGQPNSLCSTTAAPFHIRVGGVVLNVTAVAGASSPQTFTVDATPVNGVTRTILAAGSPALAAVDVAEPIYLGA